MSGLPFDGWYNAPRPCQTPIVPRCFHFLSRGDQGGDALQSGEVIGILKQMKDSMSADLSDRHHFDLPSDVKQHLTVPRNKHWVLERVISTGTFRRAPSHQRPHQQLLS